MRVAPDDEVYRVNTVWLGPRGLTFPWTARYLAYAVWLVTFLVVIGFEVVVPGLSPGIPPTWAAGRGGLADLHGGPFGPTPGNITTDGHLYP